MSLYVLVCLVVIINLRGAEGIVVRSQAGFWEPLCGHLACGQHERLFDIRSDMIGLPVIQFSCRIFVTYIDI